MDEQVVAEKNEGTSLCITLSGILLFHTTLKTKECALNCR